MISTILEPNLYMEIWVPAVVGGPALGGGPVRLIGEARRRHSMVLEAMSLLMQRGHCPARKLRAKLWFSADPMRCHGVTW